MSDLTLEIFIGGACAIIGFWLGQLLDDYFKKQNDIP